VDEQQDLDLERWQIRVPRTGQQGEFRGDEAFVFDLEKEASDQLERTLRRVNPSLRRKRPLVYRGRRLLEGDPDGVDDDDDRVLIAARTAAQDPEEAAIKLAVRELHDLRRTLKADCDARQRELERIEGGIAKARSERDEELVRIRTQIQAEQAHGQLMVRQTQEHYEGELRRARTSRAEIEEQSTKDLQNLGQQIELVRLAKEQVSRILRAPNAADVIAQLRGHVEAVADSPIGATITAHVAARVADAVAKRSGEKVEAGDAMMGFVLQGRVARLKHQTLRELKMHDAVDPRRAELLLAGADFIVGNLDLKTVASFARATTDLAR
jgi:hypothetical protein